MDTRVFAIVLTVITVAQACYHVDHFNLTALDAWPPIVVDNGDVSYTISVCYPLLATPCGATDVAVCESWKSGAKILGVTGETKLEPLPKLSGVQFSFSGGASSPTCSHNNEAVVGITCNSLAPNVPNLQYVSTVDCVTTFTGESSAVCPDEQPPVPKELPPAFQFKWMTSEANTWSVGSWMVDYTTNQQRVSYEDGSILVMAIDHFAPTPSPPPPPPPHHHRQGQQQQQRQSLASESLHARGMRAFFSIGPPNNAYDCHLLSYAGVPLFPRNLFHGAYFMSRTYFFGVQTQQWKIAGSNSTYAMFAYVTELEQMLVGWERLDPHSLKVLATTYVVGWQDRVTAGTFVFPDRCTAAPPSPPAPPPPPPSPPPSPPPPPPPSPPPPHPPPHPSPAPAPHPSPAPAPVPSPHHYQAVLIDDDEPALREPLAVVDKQPPAPDPNPYYRLEQLMAIMMGHRGDE